MRAFEFLTEAVAPAPKKVGREFNHLEDLVFTEPNGGARAVEILKNIAQDAKDISVKWDGAPTVLWGREPDGQFRLVGKNNWGREEGKSSSPEELKQFILSRGKGEDWREKFASDMAGLWPLFEAATPADFRGYVYADILFHPGKPAQPQAGKLVFTPNQTTYTVDPSSEIGKLMAKAKVAVAAHFILENFGDQLTSGDPVTDPGMFNSGTVFVTGQNYVTHQPEVNADNLAQIEAAVNKNSKRIDQFLTPQAGLSDLQNIVYTYVNQRSKAKALDSLSSKDFFNWLSTSKVSAPKQKKISDLNSQQGDVLESLLYLVRELMKAKNEVIRELDQAEGDVVAHTNGQRGGEGYIKTADAVKLVPRDRWTPFRTD